MDGIDGTDMEGTEWKARNRRGGIEGAEWKMRNGRPEQGQRTSDGKGRRRG